MQFRLRFSKTKEQVKQRHTGFRCISLLFLFSILFFGCGEYELSSKWLDREIIIDGIDTEWEGARYLIEGKNATIALRNDENYLYLRLSTPDRTIQAQMIGMGLTVWFDPEGGRGKTFGIHCPIGNPDTGIMMAGRGLNKSAGRNRDEILETAQKKVEIIGPDKDEPSTLLASEAELLDISVKMGISRRIIIYELKVPLVSDDRRRYAIGATGSGQMIGIGFETGRMDMGKLNEMREERRRESDDLQRERDRVGGLGRTRSGSNRTNRMRPAGRMTPDPFELWSKVTLASKPAGL
ncbi:MAG: hypothetical protein HOC71_16550 [Candidatus Latescibacteria bacterium]|jgi:hypothetical protein|nr:hypothetical protein [Candidatus Latescibacterota bacterium]